MPKVFLSYSARDAELVAQIAHEFHKSGIQTIDIREMSGVMDVRRTLRQAIRNADGFILLLSSPAAASSSWVSYELGAAEALDKPLLVLLSHNHSTTELPSDFGGQPIVAFDPAKPALVVREVVERLFAPA